MHVLVSGGAGYIGSTLVPILLDAGHIVTVLDRFYFGDESLRASTSTHAGNLHIVRADIRDVELAVFDGVDAVVDLAGISNDPCCDVNRELARSVNLDGAVRLARLAHAAGASRVVFASSCSIYGVGAGAALTEDSPIQPLSHYAKCKAAAEASILEFGKATGITVTALRLATVFGRSPRMRFDLAVNQMTRTAYVSGKIIVEGGGLQWRPFVHVRDVAEAIHRTLETPARLVSDLCLNIGSRENNMQILQLAHRVSELISGTEVVVTDGAPDCRNYNVSFDRMRDVLSFKPSRTVEGAVHEILEALRSGAIDPEDRRWNTLRQYQFLAEVEREFAAFAIDGRILS